jgi:hypothetical protein
MSYRSNFFLVAFILCKTYEKIREKGKVNSEHMSVAKEEVVIM